jgi:hypothetical protein
MIIYPASSQYYFGFGLRLPLSAFEVDFRHGEKRLGDFGPMPTVPGAGASETVRVVTDTGDSVTHIDISASEGGARTGLYEIRQLNRIRISASLTVVVLLSQPPRW